MRKLRLVCRIVACALVVGFSFEPGALSKSTRLTHSAQAVPVIEITKDDLFATKNWTSEHVSVLGFHLAMSRKDAAANAENHRLKLLETAVGNQSVCSKGDCDVHDAGDVWIGLTLRFGSEDSIREIDVTTAPDDAANAVRKASVVRHFKGGTRALFDDYSNALRLRLLGAESSREDLSERDPSYSGKLKYTYLRQGLVVFVSVNPHGPARTSDLVFSFVARETPVTNLIEPGREGGWL